MLPVQSAFIDWPQEPDEYLEDILGERSQRLNPLRTFTEHGIMMSAGSDGPCTDPDPIEWMYRACNHSVPEESLTVQEALKMCTYNGYYTTFDEKERGSLETGKSQIWLFYQRILMRKISKNSGIFMLSSFCCRDVLQAIKGQCDWPGSEGYEKQE